jgi:hypothetical protein
MRALQARRQPSWMRAALKLVHTDVPSSLAHAEDGHGVFAPIQAVVDGYQGGVGIEMPILTQVTLGPGDVLNLVNGQLGVGTIFSSIEPQFAYVIFALSIIGNALAATRNPILAFAPQSPFSSDLGIRIAQPQLLAGGGGTTRVFLETTDVSPWNVPASWNNANNLVECIGAGGGGSLPVWATNKEGAGGGGAAYAAVPNMALVPGGTAIFAAGTGGGANADGGVTSFNAGACLADSGKGAVRGAGADVGGAGGTAAASTGTTKNPGGAGGSANGSGNGAAGGGGAGGPHGAGLSGATHVGAASSGDGGGGADAGTAGTAGGANGGAGGNAQDATAGGVGGVGAGVSGGAGSHGSGGGGGGGPSTGVNGAGGAGGPGVAFDATHGPGGGGGGGAGSGTAPGGAGGTGGKYGGGGGGGGLSNATGGAGGLGGNGGISLSWTASGGTSALAWVDIMHKGKVLFCPPGFLPILFDQDLGVGETITVTAAIARVPAGFKPF